METLSLIPPRLIDEELALKLYARGVSEAKYHRTVVCALSVILGLMIGFIMLPLEVPNIVLLTGALLLAGWAIGAEKTRRLSAAFNTRNYDRVNRLANDALLWNIRLYPLTYFQIAACSRIQVTLLMIEGRYVEFEALTRYAWGFMDRKAEPTTTPKHWALANNLGVALLMQHRYDEASTIMKDLLDKTKDRNARIFLLNNLALSLVRSQRPQEAELYLDEAIKVVGGKFDSLIGPRLQLVRGLILLSKGALDDAAESIITSKENAMRRKEPVEFEADCEAALGAVRKKQARPEEAELHYMNAIDILESAPNPPYLTLAIFLKEFAEIKQEQGQSEEASLLLKRAEAFKAISIERDTEAIEGIKKRLSDRKHVTVATQLLEHSTRYWNDLPKIEANKKDKDEDLRQIEANQI